MNFKKNLHKFFNGKTNLIKARYKLTGSQIQKKIWNELKNIKIGHTKSYGEIAQKYNLSTFTIFIVLYFFKKVFIIFDPINPHPPVINIEFII